MAREDLPGVGVFGTGAATKVIVPLLRNEGFHVAALWGQQAAEAQQVATELEISYATHRIDDVLLRKDVDLIVILCPPTLHSQIAVKALGIGKHVTVQAPGGLSQDENLRMVQAAQYYPRLLSTLNCGLRHLPAFRKMRSAIRSELVGPRVTLCDVRLNLGSLIGREYSWLCDEKMGGGVLSLLGAHVIDLLRYLTGQRASRVMGTVGTFTKTTESIRGIRHISSDDFATFAMEMDGGAFANVTINSHLGGFAQEVAVCGAEGQLLARNGDLYVRRKEGQGKEEVLFLNVDDGSTNSSKSDGDPLHSGIYLQGLVLHFRHLAQIFASNALDSDEGSKKDGEEDEDRASFEAAQYMQAVIEAVRRSSQERKWTKVSSNQG